MLNILSKTLKNWFSDDPFTQSAAAAYYAIFALPGLLIIIMALAAIFFEEQRVEQEVFGHIKGIMGVNTAQSVSNIIHETQKSDRDVWAMIAGGFTLIFGATGLFTQLQRSLNRIWEVEIKKSAGWKAFIKSRITSFSLILVIGFLLLVSLSITTALTVFSDWLANQFSTEWSVALLVLNVTLSFTLIMCLFTLMFKVLPDAKVQWKTAFLGGSFATILFTIGEYAINYYFKWAEPHSSFGAAGSVILLMLWVSYSCMIMLIGAEFAKTYTEEKIGKNAKPESIAKRKLRKK